MKHERQNSVVHLMDCIEGMKQYPDKWFDLAIVDPPYGIGRDKKQNKNEGKWRFKKYHDSDWDSKAPDAEYWDELFRVSKNQIVWGANHYISKIPIDSSCWIVWDKVNGAGDFADCELAWTSFKTAVRKFTYYFGKENNERIHPTQKPKALYEWLLMKYAKEGDLILDTHLGSQSSRIAAHKHGLDFTGFELDAEYFEKGNKRFDDFISQTTIFDMLI
jgi:site-specific DNA-methyltransferase (adenine-specific)